MTRARVVPDTPLGEILGAEDTIRLPSWHIGMALCGRAEGALSEQGTAVDIIAGSA